MSLQRHHERWYPLIDIPEQVRLITEDYRFKVVPSGRRSGKTERAKRYLAKQAMRHGGETYFFAAPTHAQVKKIAWSDLKDLTFAAAHGRRPSESELKIYMPNGTEIHLIGLDKPERFEGIPWTGGIIDEIANVKNSAWQENIYPALNTVNPMRPDYRAWCWLIGVPEGLNHYYDMYQHAIAGNDPEWAAYQWKSSKILPDDVIDSAKRSMSAKQFRQEFEASFETAAGRIYEDYSADNYTSATIGTHEQLHWMHDQNYTPLSSAVGVIRDDDLYLLDEIILTSAVSRQSAEEFVERYKGHGNKHVVLYGDPAGRAGEKHGHESDYTEIKRVLSNAGWQCTDKVQRKHPAIKDRQNAVRARVCNAADERHLFVNPTTAPWCHRGLSTVQLLEGSTFQEDQRNEYQHVTTAIGYMIDVKWPIGTQSRIQALNL